MSIVNCMVSNLPNALESALENVVGIQKAEQFVEALMPIITAEKWSIFHPIDDLKQLKAALQTAANTAGIGWETIAEVAIATATSVGTKCFGFGSIDAYVQAIKNNPEQLAELNSTVERAFVNQARTHGYEIPLNSLKDYSKLPGTLNMTVTWTFIC